ncbi:sigma-54-dependent transcriptional regulator [Alkalilimnicola ehrlichii MLHE-1]|uniref:Two component, sigma54 specific, transcriptional regulator, Fis family n=1 Tax=Alkalilimnicola ehrlichii (strain ATCC BAA-1101 / DSM 17681 / MLHE-1) TaxID=187272 RepID=Q0AC62_ALKEH|nr:sigma-54 dependent transcriptional regulator [Alkalilimnicola ehrlichii]ABI55575.1 two component, sigma54 specific, transcriptional regulator, Fis family [Alkalilimnicola ehrlichii MLHE-1]
MSARLCLIEDDPIMGESLQDRFTLEGFQVDWFVTAAQAREHLRGGGYAAAISDIRLPDQEGDALYLSLKRDGQVLPPFIFITGHGAIETAVQLLKEGAADYVTKPFDLDELVTKVRGLAEAQGGDAPAEEGEPLLGIAPAMRRLEERLRRLARAGAGVLITGESGVGKEHAARLLHQAGAGDGERPFVAVNCGALTESLLEAELFGHERGAFTGAARARRGVFEQAQGGTLFLDEIGDMSPAMQVRLLRAIQERCITRVGGETPIPVDIHLVSATHRDLRALVESGEFREDLYYRINTVQVRIPPLRERPEDILWFAARFLAEAAAEQGREDLQGLSGQAQEALLEHHWPGNLRELRHAIDRAVILAEGPQVTPADLFDDRDEPGLPDEAGQGLTDYLRRCERAHIVQALEAHGGHMARTAASLGISRKNLWEKMKKLGVKAPG